MPFNRFNAPSKFFRRHRRAALGPIPSYGIRTVGSWSGLRKVFQIGRWREPLEVWRGNRRFGMTRFRSNGRTALLGWGCRGIFRSDGIIGGTISKASSLSFSLRLPTVLLSVRVLSAMRFRRANGFKRRVTANKPHSARSTSGKLRDFYLVDFSTRLHSTKVPRRHYNRMIFLLRPWK